MRRTTRLLLATVTTTVLLAVPGMDAASAQACPPDRVVSPPCNPPGNPPPGNPPPEVLPDEVTPPAVEPDVVTPPANTPPVAVGGETPEVLESVTPRSSSALPFTGGEIGAAGAIGLVLIGTGVAFAAAGRRRRTQLGPAI